MAPLTGAPLIPNKRIRRQPLYIPAFPIAHRLLAALALLTVLATPIQAQDRYRAEIVILERLADPILNEQMAGKAPQQIESDKNLWVVDTSGDRRSDLDTTSDLTLNSAARRLEDSGNYRVLMKTGWVQSFPPDHEGEPLSVEIGDYLEAAGHREVEGTIEINRRRYLLVTVALNHWRETAGTQSSGDQERSRQNERDEDEGAGTVASDTDTPATIVPVSTGTDNKELVTWIRETRRMRSEEIHFVDSPTIGVLIYFRPMD